MTAGTHSLTAGRLRLQFERSGDRYAHTIYIRCASGEERLLLTSLEGDDTAPWPASPPLQNVHLEQRSAGVKVALAVGMAGRSHWSLAVEALPGGELRFDVACRLSETPDQLGSRYALGGDVQVAGNDSPWALSVSPSDTVLLAGTENMAIGLVRQQGHPTGVEVSANCSDFTWPATVRWQYSIYQEIRS